MMLYISVVGFGLLVGVVIGGPVADPVEVVDIDAGTRWIVVNLNLIWNNVVL